MILLDKGAVCNYTRPRGLEKDGAGDASRTRTGLRSGNLQGPIGIQSRHVYRFHHARDMKVVGWFWGDAPFKDYPQNHFLRAATPAKRNMSRI